MKIVWKYLLVHGDQLAQSQFHIGRILSETMYLCLMDIAAGSKSNRLHLGEKSVHVVLLQALPDVFKISH